MSDAVAWMIEVAIRPGRLEAFRRLTDEMVAATASEPGALIYERFLSPDETIAHLHERYVDARSAVAHLHAFHERFADRFLEVVERRRVTVYGTVSEALRTEFDRMGAVSFVPVAGFAR